MIPGGLWIRNHQDSSDDEVLEDTASRLRTSFTPLRGNLVIFRRLNFDHLRPTPDVIPYVAANTSLCGAACCGSDSRGS